MLSAAVLRAGSWTGEGCLWQQRGLNVAPTSNRAQRVPEGFEPDARPGADAYVYCKGCGKPLESRDRLTRGRAVVDVMMCEACREVHGHPLVPTPGSPTFCYRCGGPEEVFVEPGTSPAIRHICPRCLPARAARYRAGDFAEPVPEPDEPATPAVEEKSK